MATVSCTTTSAPNPPGKQVAKKAIWAPEKHADVFMNGDSPIGIATDLGDLKIVSHGAVFDVVRQVPNRFSPCVTLLGGVKY